MKDRFKKEPHLLRYEDDKLEHVTLGFTTREGGSSPYPERAFNMARYIDDAPEHVTKHQQLLAAAIDFPRAHWVFPIQTHENKVAEVTVRDQGTNIDALSHKLYGIDGLYTYDSNVLLTMCYADCVPIYFYSESHDFVGLAHAGWRGTYGQIVIEMINQIKFPLSDFQVVIGHATSNSYEINDEIKEKFETLPIDSQCYIETRGTNRHGIDLKKANALLLQSMGVPQNNIYITQYATSEDLNLFFSYRLEEGHTGRMLAFIGRK